MTDGRFSGDRWIRNGEWGDPSPSKTFYTEALYIGRSVNYVSPPSSRGCHGPPGFSRREEIVEKRGHYRKKYANHDLLNRDKNGETG